MFAFGWILPVLHVFTRRRRDSPCPLSFDAGNNDDQMAVVSGTTFGRKLTIDGRSGNDAYDVGSGNTFSRTPTVRRFEAESIANVDGLLDAIMGRLADAGLDDLLAP